jgi:hypothetical protein
MNAKKRVGVYLFKMIILIDYFNKLDNFIFFVIVILIFHLKNSFK